MPSNSIKSSASTKKHSEVPTLNDIREYGSPFFCPVEIPVMSSLIREMTEASAHTSLWSQGLVRIDLKPNRSRSLDQQWPLRPKKHDYLHTREAPPTTTNPMKDNQFIISNVLIVSEMINLISIPSAEGRSMLGHTCDDQSPSDSINLQSFLSFYVSQRFVKFY